MKSKEIFIGNKKEGIHFLNSMLSKLFKGELQIEGEDVFLPNGEEFEFKVKFEYDEEYNYGAFGLKKIAWGEEPESEEEEEEEEEEDADEMFFNKPKDYYL